MNVLIFDGECNMCSAFVRFVIKNNKNRDFRITDFNSDWYYTHSELLPNVDSMILIINERKIYTYSDAFIHVLTNINKKFYPVLTLKILPRIIRDNVYKLIAKYRKRIVRKKTCDIPTRSQQEYFL
ncbi:DUF393 domain-containing protein [Ornithinibacillus sp. L9]|uniref:DUF393 domain-containing protein n=1 Tax=Ornithinibacillus caprae TaxID=2678566 RepID=A0A6N8FQM0_9BACI|nr:DUF393 domain-containing protein [Ornithinibacillus caprae]MUK90369.1 DUF393 domain-containing protein [Ornithinibacillus caprae]